MEKHPLVTVIIPVYNAGKYIRKCCETVFSQTYDNYEVILVNDGTPDNSIEIVRELLDGRFASLKDRVRIIDQENRGLPAARKTGLGYARGEYVIQFDPDDWVSKRILKKMVAAAVRNDADIVICNYFHVYRFWRTLRREKRYSEKLDTLDALFSHHHFRAYMWDKLVRRSLYDGDFLIPRHAMCEDMVSTAQLIIRADRICHVPNHLYYYRRTNGTSISKSKKKKVRDREIILNKFDLWDFLEARGDNPLAPIRASYMIQIAWLMFTGNATDMFDLRPGLLDEVKSYPINEKYSLDLKSQAELKKRIACYEQYKLTGDPSLLPLFEERISV